MLDRAFNDARALRRAAIKFLVAECRSGANSDAAIIELRDTRRALWEAVLDDGTREEGEGEWLVLTDRQDIIPVQVHEEGNYYVADDGSTTAVGESPRVAVDRVTARWALKVVRTIAP